MRWSTLPTGDRGQSSGCDKPRLARPSRPRLWDLNAAVDAVSNITGSESQLEASINYLDIVAEESLTQQFVADR